MKISPLTPLCLIFIALKLSGHIAWSWWWVMSPILILMFVVGALDIVIYKLEEKQK